jgi:hypothetical protein
MFRLTVETNQAQQRTDWLLTNLPVANEPSAWIALKWISHWQGKYLAWISLRWISPLQEKYLAWIILSEVATGKGNI